MEPSNYANYNHVALSPLSFLKRAAFVYGDKTSIICGDNIRFVWEETYKRCLKLASALSMMGINHGDIFKFKIWKISSKVYAYTNNRDIVAPTVVAVAPNVPALYELHFGVPMSGAVLSALNPKLDAQTLASLLQDLGPKVIFIDHDYLNLVIKSLDLFTVPENKSPLLVVIQEYDQILPSATTLTYDQFLATGIDDFEIILPKNEFDPISINFTSGSTGKPKGVVYSHRAAYLNSLAVVLRYKLKQMPVFLWTVDMFRCNGWCFTWAVAALGGINICTRRVTSELIFDSVFSHNVMHLFGAPSILTMISESPSHNHRKLPHKVEIVVAGALPPPRVIQKVEESGFDISHAYGMTEALGPFTVRSLSCDNTPSAYLNQIHSLMMEGVDVKDPTTMMSVPFDGKTIGEIMFKSNAMMTGYFKNVRATQEAFKDGWYRTRDIGVRHANGYIEIKDRCIDTIYNTYGKNISTIEVEAVLATHPEVIAAAVVGRKDGSSGQTTCAFVRLRQGSDATENDILCFCRENLSEHMVPKNVVFGDIPINSTGKVQKFVLRERAKALDELLPDEGNVGGTKIAH